MTIGDAKPDDKYSGLFRVKPRVLKIGSELMSGNSVYGYGGHQEGVIVHMEFGTTQFITPMTAWGQVGSAAQQKPVTSGDEVELFSDVFHNVVNQVYTTQADVENKQYLLATGQLDNVHTLPIAEMKASLSLDILISLRNKALESYNELMKINV